ncbi:MAG: hypothetical protein ATN35_08080 [Epulopiscium sp. Nele67-Bin004]|nr:MAG: hypothetical protein ATN35_08080 [Epulopiscium sp. Nele67-Bin004]
MKKLSAIMLSLVLLAPNLYAYEGEMGYFGGITAGIKLPTTTELMQPKKTTNATYTLPYKENIYLTGEPIEITGTIVIKPVTLDLEKTPVGQYTESYIVKGNSADGKSSINRTITLNTMYAYDPVLEQLTKTSTINRWSENVVANGKTYQLNQAQSSFSKSILEDTTPGVMYYSGDVHYDAVYNDVSAGGTVRNQVSSRVYGYDQPFAKSETQIRDIFIDMNDNQYFIQETPTYTVYKDIEYAANEPNAISLAGNYKEMIRGEGALQYNVLIGKDDLYIGDAIGSTAVVDTPRIEQLTIPSLSHLDGHPAQSDIAKMYSLKVFDVSPEAFSPNQVVTRGEYITMLTKLMQLELPPAINPEDDLSLIVPLFNDVSILSDTYPVAVAAYEAGLVDAGDFRGDDFLTREMMYILNIRLLGLERVGLTTNSIYTPFLDDSLISDNAKSSLYAASKLGLIPITNGYIFPQQNVTYADCAGFLNMLLNYLRYDLQKDYNQYIIM